MDVNSFIIYLHELRNQCLYTHAALGVFNQSLEKNNTIATLFSAQAALNAASQVGAILWPSRARARRRGEVLREKLQLPDQHALGDRRFVELWERCDEKLDDFIKETKGERILFDFVGDPQTLNAPGLKEEGIYRLYDTANQVFVYRGIGYNMVNLSKAIEEIGRRVEVLQKQLSESMNPDAGGRAEEPANTDAPAGEPQATEEKAEEKPVADKSADKSASPQKKKPATKAKTSAAKKSTETKKAGAQSKKASSAAKKENA